MMKPSPMTFSGHPLLLLLLTAAAAVIAAAGDWEEVELFALNQKQFDYMGRTAAKQHGSKIRKGLWSGFAYCRTVGVLRQKVNGRHLYALTVMAGACNFNTDRCLRDMEAFLAVVAVSHDQHNYTLLAFLLRENYNPRQELIKCV
ncbi:hypothetical protein AXF42_Ash008172 [Apostasia shenzhenica]|uniref:Cystatin domain-containing protein n=1 Tax=Apostasia shenzhenica TaxID=1088818 RepID=A0A2I0A8Q5_9ASPA|nr:hypothetical protein AXF42_Ash008172 [Apostasia shenzhenica]